MTPDMINGSFELMGGLLKGIDVYTLYRDKEVKGISMFPVYAFTLWACWNVIYYPMINQYWSFIGGLFLLVTNLTWTSMALYYKYFNKSLRTSTL